MKNLNVGGFLSERRDSHSKFRMDNGAGQAVELASDLLKSLQEQDIFCSIGFNCTVGGKNEEIFCTFVPID